MIAGINERAELVPLRVPQFRKAMAQHDQRAGACLSAVHPDSVSFNESMRQRWHGHW